VVALHIYYGNREESGLEARYLRQFCDEHGITLRMKEMPEHLRRASKAVTREEYEEQTREIRFDFYEEVLREFCDVKDAAEEPGRAEVGEVRQSIVPAGVMLGHHRGDVEENVLSNALKGAGVLSLSGMEESSVLYKINIWRPYLPIEKKDIYDFAHTYGVPYFKDTTPLWSTRGKIRTRLLPLIRDIYGDGAGSNLAILAEESREFAQMFDDTILKPAFQRIESSALGLALPILGNDNAGDLRNYGFLFWRALLRHMLHSMGIGALREASIRELLQRFRRTSDLNENKWLELRKDLLSYLGNGRLYLLNPSFAYCGTVVVTKGSQDSVGKRRPHQFQPWGEHGTAVELDREKVHSHGPWRIRAWVERDLGDEARSPQQSVAPLVRRWPQVLRDIPPVEGLFTRSMLSSAPSGEVLLAYELVVSKAALEASNNSLTLDTLMPEKREPFKVRKGCLRVLFGSLMMSLTVPTGRNYPRGGMPIVASRSFCPASSIRACRRRSRMLFQRALRSWCAWSTALTGTTMLRTRRRSIDSREHDCAHQPPSFQRLSSVFPASFHRPPSS